MSTTAPNNSPFQLGMPENRLREQFTARITRHPKGKPGHVYLAQDIAYIRADTLGELQALVANFAWEHTDAAA